MGRHSIGSMGCVDRWMGGWADLIGELETTKSLLLLQNLSGDPGRFPSLGQVVDL